VTDLASESEAILELLRADLLASVGLALEARVRLVTPEEQRALDVRFDAMWDDPKTTRVVLGSSTSSGFRARPLSEYESYWALEMPHTLTAIFEAVDVLDVVQEEVIEELWGDGRSASWPECPEHGGHPLDSAIVEGRLMWRCPRDPAIAIPLGGLGRDGRFTSA
jgi:hypothetical protein